MEDAQPGYLVARMLGLQRWRLANIQHVTCATARARRLQFVVRDVISIAHLDFDATRLIVDREQHRWIRAVADPADAAVVMLVCVHHFPLSLSLFDIERL